MDTTLLSDLAVGERFMLRERKREDIGREFVDTGRDLGIATVVAQNIDRTVVELDGVTIELTDRRVAVA